MTKDIATLLATHLEYLGYEVRQQDDKWSIAAHPTRWNFHFRAFDIGVRVHCAIVLHKRLPNRDAWLEFVNRANDSARLARFALVRDAEGDNVVRIRTLLPRTYDRRTFGLLLDAWHEDVALLRTAPPNEEEDEAADGEAVEEEDGKLVVVN
jgi:hypothetical protein